MTHSAAWSDTLKSIGGALLFRRSAVRRLFHNPQLIKRFPVFLIVLLLCTFSVELVRGSEGDVLKNLLPASGIAFAHLAFWLIILFAVAEPVFDLLLRSATFDEAELHWWSRWRMTSRVGLFAAFVAAYIFYALIFVLLSSFPGGDMVAGALATIWGYLILSLIAKDWWNNISSQANIITSGPIFVFFAAVYMLSYPWPVPLTMAVICLALAPLTMPDIALRRKARRCAKSLAEDPTKDHQYWHSSLELLHRAGDQALVQKLLDSLHEDEAKRDALPSWALIRLLSASGQFLEAVDAGLAALDRQPDSLPLHLAMAEACLGVRDPENAVAHAEEALDLAGGTASTEEGSEALLLLALASYNQREVISGLHACSRVIDCAHHDPSPRLKRIVNEARMLARRFGIGIEEGE